jgi:hypothetical protein
MAAAGSDWSTGQDMFADGQVWERDRAPLLGAADACENRAYLSFLMCGLEPAIQKCQQAARVVLSNAPRDLLDWQLPTVDLTL